MWYTRALWSNSDKTNWRKIEIQSICHWWDGPLAPKHEVGKSFADLADRMVSVTLSEEATHSRIDLVKTRLKEAVVQYCPRRLLQSNFRSRVVIMIQCKKTPTPGNSYMLLMQSRMASSRWSLYLTTLTFWCYVCPAGIWCHTTSRLLETGTRSGTNYHDRTKSVSGRRSDLDTFTDCITVNWIIMQTIFSLTLVKCSWWVMMTIGSVFWHWRMHSQ